MSCDDECEVEKDAIQNQAYFGGYVAGREKERKRILRLINDYWCGEPNCKQHGTDWEDFIKAIEGNK